MVKSNKLNVDCIRGKLDSFLIQTVDNSIVITGSNKLLNGKWNHIVDQNHISYTYWQQPDRDLKPGTVTITALFDSEMGISVEESEQSWSNNQRCESLPVFYSYGTEKHSFEILTEEKSHLIIQLCLQNHVYISMEATSYKKSQKYGDYFWDSIMDLGRTGSGMTIFPGFIQKNGSEAKPHMDYSTYSFGKGVYKLEVYISPINNYTSEGSLKLILAIDNQKTLILDIHKVFSWDQAVGENIWKVKSEMEFIDRGLHNIRISSQDVGIVLQKIVLSKNRIPVSYLDPEESFRTVMESTNEY